MAKLRKKTRLFADVMGKIIQILFQVLRTITGPAIKPTVEIIKPTGTKNITTISNTRAQNINNENRKRKKNGQKKVKKMKIVNNKEKLNVRPIINGKLIKVKIKRERIKSRIEGRKGR